MADFACGRYGKVVIDSTTFNVQGWTYNEDGTNGDTTHTGGSGVETVNTCTTAYTGSITMVFDLDASQMSTTPTVRRGSTGTAKFYVSDTKYIQIAIKILSATITSAVKDVIKYDATWQGTAAPSTVVT